jgi:threonine/homoserine/homoserine lactone efflux protein
MTLTGFLIFLAAYVTAVASPGPAVAAVVARSLGRGLSGIGFMIAGIALGDMIWFFAAATGLAVIAQTYGELLVFIKLAGAVYLAYLAWKLWSAPAVAADLSGGTKDEQPWRMLAGGLSLTLGNPKPIIFFMAILPTIVDLTTLDAIGMLEIAAVIPIGIFGVLGTYAFTADRARRLFTKPRSVQILNRSTAVIMAGAAVAVARS